MSNYEYCTISDVVAYTRHLLDGETTFNTDTRPTGDEVVAFIRRASSVLNTALAGEGLTVPITQEIALGACEDWVVGKAAAYVEMTQRGTGFDEGEGSRLGGFDRLYKDAAAFAKASRMGFVNLGVGISYNKADGLRFTAIDAPAERTDPSDTSLAQPVFRRGAFNTPGSGQMTSDTPDADDED